MQQHIESNYVSTDPLHVFKGRVIYHSKVYDPQDRNAQDHRNTCLVRELEHFECLILIKSDFPQIFACHVTLCNICSLEVEISLPNNTLPSESMESTGNSKHSDIQN